MSRDTKSHLAFLYRFCFLQLVLYHSQVKLNASFEMSVPTAFQAELYLHAVVLMSKEEGKQNQNVILSEVNGTFAAMIVQLRQKT